MSKNKEVELNSPALGEGLGERGEGSRNKLYVTS